MNDQFDQPNAPVTPDERISTAATAAAVRVLEGESAVSPETPTIAGVQAGAPKQQVDPVKNGILKLIHHSHSGRLKPHEHTSYIPLALMVLLVGFLLVSFSVQSFVQADPRDPQYGSIGLTGQMPTKPPSQAATIDTPKNGQRFPTSPITISGTCPSAVLVEVYKNNIFAGSAPCETDGTFSLQIDLLYGQNTLTAQVYDVLNQAGPVSNIVTIFYDATPPLAASLNFLNFGASQLLLNTDSVYRGTFPEQVLNVPISILGGAAPFAVNVQWGDSTNKVIPRSDNTVFNASHTYKKAGTYKVTFQATDGQQQVAFLTVAAIVNGQPAVLNTSNSQGSGKALNKLLVLWPLYAILITLVSSFWLGERHEKKVLGRVIAMQQNPTLGATPRPTV